jgi:hypothetical protein
MAAAAAERKRQDRPDRFAADAAVAAQVLAGELLAAIHHPVCNAVQRRPHLGRDPAAGQHREAPGQIGGDDRPARRRHPDGRALDKTFGNLCGLERQVHGADDLEQRFVPLDGSSQLTLKHAEAVGEIKTRGGERQFAGTSQLGSAFADRADRLIRRSS